MAFDRTFICPSCGGCSVQKNAPRNAESREMNMIFGSEAAVTDAKLTYERTVERSLVHRAAVSEVFVTDLRSIDTDRYLAGAQLPLSHGYYSDHRPRPASFDTLLLLESCRQASIYGA